MRLWDRHVEVWRALGDARRELDETRTDLQRLHKVRQLTMDTDGNPIDPRAEIPIGEILAALEDDGQ